MHRFYADDEPFVIWEACLDYLANDAVAEFKELQIKREYEIGSWKRMGVTDKSKQIPYDAAADIEKHWAKLRSINWSGIASLVDRAKDDSDEFVATRAKSVQAHLDKIMAAINK